MQFGRNYINIVSFIVCSFVNIHADAKVAGSAATQIFSHLKLM